MIECLWHESCAGRFDLVRVYGTDQQHVAQFHPSRPTNTTYIPTISWMCVDMVVTYVVHSTYMLCGGDMHHTIETRRWITLYARISYDVHLKKKNTKTFVSWWVNSKASAEIWVWRICTNWCKDFNKTILICFKIGDITILVLYI